MRTLSKILILIAVMSCVGCCYQAKVKEFDLNASPKIAKLDSEKGIVYFYRPSFNNVCCTHNYILKIGINNRIVGALYTGAYFYIKLKPGIYTFQATTTDGLEKISIEVKGGGIYYIKVGCNFENLLCDPVFTRVSSEVGRMDIGELKYIPLKRWESLNNK